MVEYRDIRETIFAVDANKTFLGLYQVISPEYEEFDYPPKLTHRLRAQIHNKQLLTNTLIYPYETEQRKINNIPVKVKVYTWEVEDLQTILIINNSEKKYKETMKFYFVNMEIVDGYND